MDKGFITTFRLDGRGTHQSDGFRIYPSARLFQAGEYPGKGKQGGVFVITPEELQARCQKTGPLSLNLEHVDFSDPDNGALTALNGQIGRIESMWIDPKDPRWLMGEVSIPVWLDAKLQNKGLSMEVPFAPNSSFSGCALTYTPHIERAALMSEVMGEFSRSRTQGQRNTDATWAGMWAIEHIHDYAAEHGAICGSPTSATATADGGFSLLDTSLDKEWEQARAEFMTKKEGKTLQSIHDLCIAHGVKCKFQGRETSSSSPNYSEEPIMDEKQIEKHVESGIKSFFTRLFGGGNSTPPEPPTPTPAVTESLATETTVLSFPTAAEFKAHVEKIASLEQQLADMETKNQANFHASNEAVIEQLVRSRKLTPAAKADFSLFSNLPNHKGKTAQAVRAENPDLFDLLFSAGTPTSASQAVPAQTVYKEQLAMSNGNTPPADLKQDMNAIKALMPIQF